MLDKLTVGSLLQYEDDVLELVEIRMCNDNTIRQQIFRSPKAYNTENGEAKQYEIITDLKSNENTFIEQVGTLKDNGDTVVIQGIVLDYFDDIKYKVDKIIGKNIDNISKDLELVYSVYIDKNNDKNVVLRVTFPAGVTRYYVDRELNINSLVPVKEYGGKGMFIFLTVLLVILFVVALVLAFYSFAPNLMQSFEDFTGIAIKSWIDSLFCK